MIESGQIQDAKKTIILLQYAELIVCCNKQ
jgi:hypothetical protein